MIYADVIVDISLEKLDKTFQYAVPDHLSERIKEGSVVIVPFGKGQRFLKGYVMSLSEEPKIDPAKIKPIRSLPEDELGPEEQMIALAAWMKKNYGGTMNQALKTVLPVHKKYTPREEKYVCPAVPKDIMQGELNALLSRKKHSVAKERLIRELLSEEEIPWDVITGKLSVPSSNIRDLEKKGILRVTSKHIYRNPLSTQSLEDSEKAAVFDLNPEQKAAADTVKKAMEEGKGGTFLLYGVTGSGKTEVYMDLIEETLRKGKEAIVLIPEISLTYQTVMRFYHRFGDLVSILNSRMSPGERYDQFERAKKGDCRIMVGPRSALFTPFPNLGIIIIDEEHESSYKSEQSPRYHARETAEERVRYTNAVLVLGSATPSLESYNRAEKGEITLLTLKKRVEKRPLPVCEVVDLRKELSSGNRSILSRRLKELMEDRLKREEQIMLFLNRRGMLSAMSCRSCGEVIKCPHCSVSLSLHRDGKLHCHYCGHEEPKPSVCPSCGSKYLGGFKAGTEKIEDEVQKTFPKARVIRMDADTTKGKEGYDEILSAFKNREADILVGTQMIVKGHDFPGVTLMGVLAADLSLNVSDFHAAERTFQLIVQAAGRAGRGEDPGNVVIQTYQPDHYAVMAASDQDYEGFFRQEMAYRSLLSYPPKNHMLLILITSDREKPLNLQASSIADMLKDSLRGKCIVSGPYEAPVYKINDTYRKVIFVKHEEYAKLVEAKDLVEQSLNNAEGFRVNGAYVWFDFDPANM